MDDIQHYFICDNCANKDFSPIYSFSLSFHRVNFSDDLIYDELVEETFRCTSCQKTFTKKQIEEGLAEFKKKHKRPGE